jgi:Mrp family chromosome partitioning ATPase
MRIRSSEGRAVELAERETGFDEDTGVDRNLLLNPGNGRLSPYAKAAFDPDDPVSRTARSIRMSISSAATSAAPIRSLAVLNIDASFEASVLAANLAITYAQGNVRTVIIDATTIDALHHELLGVSEGYGLTAVLNGDVDALSAIEPTRVRNLFVLSVGTASQNSSLLLDGERFHRRVMPLLDSFGMMIVDVGMAFEDPPAFCETLDGAVLIVRRNRTTIAAIQHLVGRLGDMKTRVVGTLIVG